MDLGWAWILLDDGAASGRLRAAHLAVNSPARDLEVGALLLESWFALTTPEPRPRTRSENEGAVMEIVQEQFGPADLLRLTETDLAETGSDDVLMGVHCPTVSPHALPILRGAAYLAALKGDPWRPQM